MVFVTGGTGLLGATLIIDLLKKGETVIALKRTGTPVSKFEAFGNFYPFPPELTNNLSWVDGSVTDYDFLTSAIPENCCVYHCAAEVSFNPADKDRLYVSNVEGTANVVNACIDKNVKKLCHVSSIGALGGKINGKSINEETPWSAIGKSDYSTTKYFSEMEVWRGIAEGLSAVIVNPAVILGPGNWDRGSPSLFKLAAKGQPFYTLGSTGYVDVRDVSKAMILLMDSDIDSERFILCSGSLSYKSFFTKIAESLHVNPPKIYANYLLTSVAWRLYWIVSKFSGKKPQMTRQTHRVSHIKDSFNGSKITERLPFSYIPLDETINFIASKYQKNKLSV